MDRFIVPLWPAILSGAKNPQVRQTILRFTQNDRP